MTAGEKGAPPNAGEVLPAYKVGEGGAELRGEAIRPSRCERDERFRPPIRGIRESIGSRTTFRIEERGSV